jgi:hypothetical protein
MEDYSWRYDGSIIIKLWWRGRGRGMWTVSRLAQNWVHFWAFVNIITNYCVPQKVFPEIL